MTERLWRNSITYAGAILTIAGVLLIVGVLFLDFIAGHSNPYLGILAFLFFPIVVISGFLLMIGGVLRRRRKLRQRLRSLSDLQYYPRIDLNLPSHRRVLFGLFGGVLVALPFLGFMSYEGYHYTESQSFCGGVCHPVMKPHGDAAAVGAHAQVECAACHVGRGPSWWLKSKVTGVRQVFVLMADSYERPLPPALHALRPATDTCQNCHWPGKYFGDQLRIQNRFAADEDSTPFTFWMLVKTGGSDPNTAPPSGIHWHMALHFDTEYVARDEYLREIPWVRVTDTSTGRTRVFRSDGEPSDAPPPNGIMRKVDCMDCHNRAAHAFDPPAHAVDAMLSSAPELRRLPFAKRAAVEALIGTYESQLDAEAGVAASLRKFYESDHPEVLASHRGELVHLIEGTERIYEHNFFPEMNVDWRAYPSNIGHKTSPGCFRCHAGDHSADDGSVISSDCVSCHEFVVPSGSEKGPMLMSEETFPHPVEFAAGHARIECHRCHDGGRARENTCEGCHTEVVAFRGGDVAALERFEIEADSMDGLVECADCHDLTRPLAAVQEACLACHEVEEYGEDPVDQWNAEIAKGFAAVDAVAGDEERKVLDTLKAAGPLHNMEATRAILRSLVEGTGAEAAAVAPTD